MSGNIIVGNNSLPAAQNVSGFEDPMQALEKDLKTLYTFLQEAKNDTTPGSIPADLRQNIASALQAVQKAMGAVQASAQAYADGQGGSKYDYDVVFNGGLFGTLHDELAPLFGDANLGDPTFQKLDFDVTYMNGSGEITNVFTNIINFEMNPIQN
jgi:hypothetical protein